jgi:hypothetical protein
MITASRIVWEAAGSPDPCDVFGIPIASARGSVSHCAKCNDSAGVYSLAELISSSFVPTKNANRLHAFGGAHYCAACVFCARTLRLRCISWFASTAGVRFWRTRPETQGAPRPDALASLLDPPDPPFVCGVPLYGIAHGGENTSKDAPEQGPNYLRTWWPGEPRHPTPLIKLQSKHVALYAREAHSRDRYPVQVDDVGEFLLDRDTWLYARDDAAAAMAELVDAGLKTYPAKLSLRALTLQGRVPAGAARRWRTLVEPLAPHVGTIWWPLFCDLLLEIKPDATTRENAASF